MSFSRIRNIALTYCFEKSFLYGLPLWNPFCTSVFSKVIGIFRWLMSSTHFILFFPLTFIFSRRSIFSSEILFCYSQYIRKTNLVWIIFKLTGGVQTSFSSLSFYRLGRLSSRKVYSFAVWSSASWGQT